VQVGRYRFLDRLAVGGMAEVFVAVAQGSEGFEKPVVIKRLLPELARQPRFQQMFLDEARIMLNLQHGNIVQILDMGRMEGVPFLTLEYVHGKDLRTILHRARDCDTKIPHALCAHIVEEVCRALDYAHRKTDEEGKPLHIVHRDVNPANILVSHEGEVKVSDFGLAKARDNLEQSDSGVIKGKLSYVSPEQAFGEDVDNRSDIFSLGTTLYEITCGRRPFEAETDVQVVMKVREVSFPRPSEVVPDFNPDLEAIILKAMRKERAERYQTASHMREELSRWLQRFPAPPSDRELMDWVNGLFPERRSNSALFRLTPIAHLPPTMTSVARADGLSEFHQANTPSPTSIPVAGLERVPGGPSRPPPHPASSRPPTGSTPPRTAAGTLGSSDESGPVERMKTAEIEIVGPRSGLLWPILALLIVAALGGAGFFIYKQLRPALPAATLSVTSTPPDAVVLLDGTETGHRTPAVLLNLAVNREYLVVVKHPVGGERQQRFRFDRGGPHAYHFELGPGKESLSFTSEPEGCDVLINGELRGQAPLTIDLPRGRKYAIELRKTGYLRKVVQHYAERDKDTLRLELEPEPKPKAKVASPTPKAGTGSGAAAPAGNGTLEIATDLRAKVLINDKPSGRTPGFRVSLPPGTYRVMVIPDDVKIRHAANITVVAGQTHRLTLTSAPTP
jgi:serine/threonine protein kinase